MKLDDDMQRVVREQRLGFVATVSADGTPNLSPKGTLDVWDDEHLAFLDIHSPATVANLRARPAVEVNVVDPIVRKGYRFKGRGEVLTEGPRRDEALAPLPRQLKFELRAQKGKTMDPARMQMDWMRYWSMRAPNEKSIKAPQLELSTFNGAC